MRNSLPTLAGVASFLLVACCSHTQAAPASQKNPVSPEATKDEETLESFRNSPKLDFAAFQQFVEKAIQQRQDDQTIKSLQLTLEICQALTTWNFSMEDAPKARALAYKYADKSLKHKDVPSNIEAGLTLCLLPQQLQDLRTTSKSDIPQARLYESRKWIHAIQSLESTYDPNFDINNPNNWAKLTVLPPPGAGLPFLGASPQAIKDPHLRLEYEKAIKENAAKAAKLAQQKRVRRMMEVLLPATQSYLIEGYSKQPYNMDELNGLLNQVKDDNFKKNVLTSVEQNMEKEKQTQ